MSECKNSTLTSNHLSFTESGTSVPPRQCQTPNTTATPLCKYHQKIKMAKGKYRKFSWYPHCKYQKFFHTNSELLKRPTQKLAIKTLVFGQNYTSLFLQKDQISRNFCVSYTNFTRKFKIADRQNRKFLCNNFYVPLLWIGKQEVLVVPVYIFEPSST